MGGVILLNNPDAPAAIAVTNPFAILNINLIGLSNKLETATCVRNVANLVKELSAINKPPLIARNIPPAAASCPTIVSPILFNASLSSFTNAVIKFNVLPTINPPNNTLKKFTSLVKVNVAFAPISLHRCK